MVSNIYTPLRVHGTRLLCFKGALQSQWLKLVQGTDAYLGRKNNWDQNNEITILVFEMCNPCSIFDEVTLKVNE